MKINAVSREINSQEMSIFLCSMKFSVNQMIFCSWCLFFIIFDVTAGGTMAPVQILIRALRDLRKFKDLTRTGNK